MNTSDSLLQALVQAGALRTIDHALAQSLRRLEPTTPDNVLAAAALASLAISKGHAGFLPAQPQALLDVDIDWPQADDWIAQLRASPWVSTPVDSTDPADPQSPLVLEGAVGEPSLLYLRRYREYERRLALGLQRIGSHAPEPGNPAALAPLFAQLFPRAPTATRPENHHNTSPVHGRGRAEGAGEGALSIDHQARAAALALRHNLLLVTGGPGTGKTTTITRLLVLLAAQAQHAGRSAPRIALAAPTGRAAERMAESLRNATQALAALGVDAVLIAQLPTTGTTLHRLLGTLPDSPRFRHHADNPLPFDVIVVDEASMIDLPLMAKLVEAVDDGARLVLLGDPDQLPSVEAGDVLSGILRAAGDGNRIADDDAEALRPLLGDTAALPISDSRRSDRHPSDHHHSLDRHASGANPSDAQSSYRQSSDHHPPDRHPRESGDPATLLPTSSDAQDPHLTNHSTTESRGYNNPSGFPGAHVHLQRGYRQSAALDLPPLATTVREGDSNTALSLLRGGTLAGVHFHEDLTDPLQAQRERLLAHCTALADAASPAEALALAGRLRILTAVREGPQGARGLNARIEELLGGTRRGVGPASNRYFHGRLLLITENSYRHRLFNGDIGICLRDEQGALVAWFPGDDPQHPRAFHPAALPAHESAFAMTVHKAQGSEFEEVWLLLPARFNRVLSRELVYTGITRARQQLHLAGSEAVIREALARHASRWSGLGWRLDEAQRGNARPNLAPAPSREPHQGALF
jgi:exodeoxyribonuclease V alpha subunit